MKGIIFNLLEEIVGRESGEDAWDALLEAAQLDGVYSSLGSYADADLMKLVQAMAASRKEPPEAVLRFFGARAIPLLAARYPIFFDSHRSTRSFLLTLNDIIHPEVRKLYPGADVPDFGFDARAEDVLVMSYASSRKLCALAEGLIHGAAAHFGEEARIAQPECMLRGDRRCVLRITFGGREERRHG